MEYKDHPEVRKAVDEIFNKLNPSNGSKIQKYNPIWLESNNFDDNWHEEQAAILENAINNCRSNYLVIVVTDGDVLEAMAKILFRYEFSVESCGNMGAKSIKIRVR